MPSLLYTGPRESRAPETEVLPDGRKRLTRYLEVNSKLELPAELNLSPGTPDIYTAAPSGWTGLLLTYFKMVDDVAPKGKDSRPMLQMIWEQISPSGETPVGGVLERELPDGRIGYERNSVMFSFNAFTPGIVGSDTAPNDSSAFLQSVEAQDDGTLRQIKRTYVYAGELATDTQTKNNGALSIITTTWAVTVPATPGGYTLIGQPIQNPNGYPIYTYTFAKGTGQISEQIEYRQSPDVGVTGVTITTIKYLTVPSVNTNPVTPPSGGVEIGVTVDDLDGYRLWTAQYAAGAGIIYSTVEQRNGGKLVIYKVTSLNAIPSPPSSTIGGAVTQISATKQNGSRFESGVLIYEYAWAEGEGEISQEITYSQSKDQGTNGITRTVIKYLTALSISSDPTSAPSGAINIGVTFENSEGYRIWTSTYAKGQGTISSEVETREEGCLVFYKITALGTAPSAPSATIGGSVVLIDEDSRTEGGFTLYTYTWVEGNGQSSITVRGESDGSLLYEVVTFTASASTPSYPGSGSSSLIDLEQKQESGYMRNQATYRKWPATQNLSRQKKFTMPGQIEPTSPDPGFQLIPPIEMDILATETISYSTSQDTTTPFTVSGYAGLQYSYTPTGGQPAFKVVGADKYLSGGTSDSGGSATFNGISVSAYAYEITASTPTAPPSGSTTIEVENDVYLVDISGTVVYRRRVVTYSF